MQHRDPPKNIYILGEWVCECVDVFHKLVYSLGCTLVKSDGEKRLQCQRASYSKANRQQIQIHLVLLIDIDIHMYICLCTLSGMWATKRYKHRHTNICACICMLPLYKQNKQHSKYIRIGDCSTNLLLLGALVACTYCIESFRTYCL